MNKRMLALLAASIAALICLPVGQVTAADAEPGVADNATVSSPPKAVEADYRISEEDVLRLDVWGEPQLSSMQMQVTPGGKVNVPFLGEMQVKGLTQTEFSALIVKKLAELDILYEAKVQITIISLHRPQVRILGAVQRPGPSEFKDGDTILDAIAMGGSFSDDAMLESATLTHQGSTTQIPMDLKKLLAKGDLSQNYKLQNGDVIYIPHEDYNNKFYVLGQVNRPGQFPLKDNTTLTAAISLAAGATERGNIRKSVIIRGDPAKPERITSNLSRLWDKGDRTQDIVLKPGDVVYVPESKRIDWNKISQIINTVVNVGYIRRMGLF